MANKLVIVESKVEAEYFCRQAGSLEPGTKVLALLPEAGAYLKTKNIPHENTLRYLTHPSHEHGLKAVDKIISKVNQSVIIKDDDGFSHTYLNTFTFYLRGYVSYLILMVEVILNFIQEEHIDRVEVCRFDREAVGGWVLAPQEYILDRIVDAVAQCVPIKVHAHTLVRKNTGSGPVEWSKTIYRTLYNRMVILRSRSARQPSVLFYGLKFNFNHLAKDLTVRDIYNLIPEKNMRFQFTEEKNGMLIHNLQLDYWGPQYDRLLQESLAQVAEKLSRLAKEEKLFVYRDVDLSTIVLGRIKTGFIRELKILNRKIRSLKKTLTAIRPSLVISPMSRELSFALGEVSRRLHIPSILISHGSHVPPKNEYERMEWFDHGKGLIDTEYQYHLLQSPWAVQYVESLGIKKDYYRIMPLIFPKVDRSKKQEKQLEMYPTSTGKKIIVHASTPKVRGSNRLYIYETLDEYIQNMIDLIEATKDMRDVFLIIRFRPSEYLQTEDLKKLLPASDHYVIATEGSFNDYLTIADLVVSFSSTTIEEALINNVAVLQYDRTGRYQHIEGAQWAQGCFSQKDSVYFIGQQQSLKDGVRWIVQQYLSQPIPKGLFDRHVFDPQRTMTAAEFIRRILFGKSNAPEGLQEALVGSKKG